MGVSIVARGVRSVEIILRGGVDLFLRAAWAACARLSRRRRHESPPKHVAVYKTQSSVFSRVRETERAV